MKKVTKLLLLSSFLLVLADQISKLLIKGFSIFGFTHKGFEYGERVEFISDIVQFTFVENPGMAFSIEFGAGKIFLSLFSVVAGILLTWYLTKISDKPLGYQIALSLILAGAVGNMVDRVFYGVIFDYAPIFYGKVVDFILVDIPDLEFMGRYYDYFPVFNIADSCVSVGIVMLIFYNKYIPSLSDFSKKDEFVNDKEEENRII